MNDHLIGVIGAVRKRRNLLIVLRGLAITIAATAALLVITGLAAYRFRLSVVALVSLRIFAVSSLIAAAYFALVRPLRRRASDAPLARLVQENHPGVEDRFVSAIEFSGEETRAAFSPVIIDRLVDDADRHARDVSVDEIVPRKRFWQFGGAAAASLALFIAALIFGPKELTMGIAQIITPQSEVAASNATKFEVKPGTARVPKGSDQKISARLLNFNAEQATVFTRKAGASDDQWVGQMMEPAKNNNEFQYFIFNIQDDTEYWVESNGVKSEVFKLTVADLPYVKRIDQTQSYPAYTGLAPKTIEDAPNVSVLAGATVKLVARLTGKAKAARIVLREGGKIEMEKVGETDLAASMTVNKENTYHIEVTSVEGDVYNGSNEYDISLLEDRPPTVTFEKPGRDTRATSVEEVLTQAKAEDDYGVLSLDLYFAVNGGEEKKVDLQKLKGESAREMTGAHTFFLEEFGLQPGDLISYYAKARDAHKETTSDIYFIEVKPFEKEFRQAQQQGDGQGEPQEGLTKRQKEVIAATFRVNRDEATYSEKEKEDNYNTIALAQEKLHEDAVALVERIKRRMGDGLGQNQDFVKLVEHVTQASKEMEPAIKELKSRKAKDAMPPEQRALKELQRADAIFREIQVSFNQSGQGQNSQQAEELADLFELEMDKRKNQYETLNREQQQQSQQQDDETKRKLEELARRMQREVEQQQQRMQQARNQSGGGGGRQQQQMIDEARKAARELERLSRERRDPRMQDLANRLNQAADEMQRAQNAAQNNKDQESLARNLRAMQQLEDAQRQLNRLKQSRGGQSIQDLKQRAAQAAQRQSEITKDVEDLARRARSGDSSVNNSKQQLSERKGELANEVGNLERDIDQAARGLNQEQQGAANKLREAAGGLRQNRVQDRIRTTRRLMEMNQFDVARQRDQTVQQNLEQLEQQLADAEKNAQRKGAGGETEDALERTRKLADNIESMRRQLGDRNRPGNQKQDNNGAQPDGQQRDGNQQDGNQPGRKGNEQRLAQNQNGPQNQNGRGQNQNQGQQEGKGQSQDGRGQDGQQQGGQPSGGQGGPQGGSDRNPTQQNDQANRGGGPPRGYDRRQLGSEIRESLREAEDIRRNLGKDRDLASGIDQAIQGLRRANDALMRDDMQTALLLKDQVIEPLRDVELELSKRLQLKLGKNNLRLSDEGEAPAAYRRLVDEYYKRLSSRSK